MSPKEPQISTINQKAIHVDADDFSALIDSMGDKAYNQRFTVSRRGTAEPTDAIAIVEGQDTPVSRETEARAPIDVPKDLLELFTFGGSEHPAIQKWLDENGIKQGEEVDIRIPGPNGELLDRRVSTNPNTFFIPVDKLVQIETDEFEHAQIMPKRYGVGTAVIVERNVYDEKGKRTGDVDADLTGWKVKGYGLKNGEPSTLVQKFEGTQVFDKEVTDTELEAIQTRYSPESRRQPVAEVVVRKTGHQELSSAGIIEPKPKTESVASVDSAKTESPAQTREEQYNALPKEVQDEVDRYRTAVRSKADAEANKDYAGAADAGRYIYDVGKGISAAAQSFVGFRP